MITERQYEYNLIFRILDKNGSEIDSDAATLRPAH